MESNMNAKSLSSYSVFLLNDIGRFKYSDDESLSVHISSDHILYFIVEGEGRLQMGEAAIDFKPMQLLYWPPDTNVEVTPLTESLEIYALAFQHYKGGASGAGSDSLQLSSTSNPVLDIGNVELQTKPQSILQRIEQIEAFGCKDEHSDQIQLHFQELLYTIIQDSSSLATQDASTQGIEQTITYMKTHFQDKLDMSTLSSMARLTASSFSRSFKKIMGEPPIEYLTRLRIESAKELLSQQDCRIKEVSSAVGYDDEFYFSRIFHKAVGVSPTFYMKRNRMKVAVASCLRFQDSLSSFGIQPAAAVNCCRYPGMGDAEYEHILATQWKELMGAKPDLIIGDKYHQVFQAKFNEIAPTVMVAKDRDWLLNYRKLAEMLGRQKEAEQAIRQLALKVVAAKRKLRHGMRNKTVSVMQINHLGIRIQGTVDHPLNELLFRELGLKPGGNVPQHIKMLELQPEWLPPLEADYLFVLKKNPRAGSDQIFERMVKTDAWNDMAAVKKNQVLHVPHWLRMSWNPVGREVIMDEVLRMTGALEEQ
jgi:AraC-like DNA-binding protein/ABC-type Fe3+-hydroxamate transport system substrate-binding protein